MSKKNQNETANLKRLPRVARSLTACYQGRPMELKLDQCSDYIGWLDKFNKLDIREIGFLAELATVCYGRETGTIDETLEERIDKELYDRIDKYGDVLVSIPSADTEKETKVLESTTDKGDDHRQKGVSTMKTTNEKNNQSTTNIQAAEMATKVQELMAEGLSMADALTKVLSETKAQRATSSQSQKRDTVTYMQECRNIPEVRRLKKIAYAKISKSQGKDEAIARYRKEIEIADQVLNQLLSEVYSAEVPYLKAMELGEDDVAAFNIFLQSYKDEIDEAMDELAKKKGLTKSQVKSKITEAEVDTSDIPEVLLKAATTRLNNGDMQVKTLLKKVSALKALQK